MNGLLIFLYFCAIAVACYFIGERIGYLRGRAERAAKSVEITINQCLDEKSIEKEMRACGILRGE